MNDTAVQDANDDPSGAVEPGAPDSPRSPQVQPAGLSRRRSSGVLWAVLMILVAALGWLAATAFQSPAQREANASPPPPQPVLVEVRQGALEQTITARSDISPSGQIGVRIPASSGVVTGVPAAAGTPVGVGDVVLEINGRPLFLVPGAFRYYRDLRSGDTGPDVEQLQDFLRSEGRRIPNSETGTVGRSTLDALERTYRQAGYTVPTTEAPATGTPAGEADAAPAPELRYFAAQEATVTGGLPATVVSVPMVGTEVTGEQAIAIGAGGLQAVLSVPDSVATALQPGMDVELTGPDGTILAGTIGSADQAVQGEDGSWTIPLSVADIPSAWSGTNLLTTIHVSRTEADALLVPSRSIAQDAAGRMVVLKEAESGVFEEISVEETARSGGESAVQVADGTLMPGDRVRVDVAP